MKKKWNHESYVKEFKVIQLNTGNLEVMIHKSWHLTQPFKVYNSDNLVYILNKGDFFVLRKVDWQ